ncbi:7493_t:CDS:1, partial [Dentiscutata erythropus]
IDSVCYLLLATFYFTGIYIHDKDNKAFTNAYGFIPTGELLSG